MKAPVILYANESNTAKMFDLTLTEFRSLVQNGYLPPGRRIAPGLIRWSVHEMQSVADGSAQDGGACIQW